MNLSSLEYRSNSHHTTTSSSSSNNNHHHNNNHNHIGYEYDEHATLLSDKIGIAELSNSDFPSASQHSSKLEILVLQ
jgi:hypothetical protein